MNTKEKAFEAFQRHINGTAEMDVELAEIYIERLSDRLLKRYSDKELIELSFNNGQWVLKARKLRDALAKALNNE